MVNFGEWNTFYSAIQIAQDGEMPHSRRIAIGSTRRFLGRKYSVVLRDWIADISPLLRDFFFFFWYQI